LGQSNQGCCFAILKQKIDTKKITVEVFSDDYVDNGVPGAEGGDDEEEVAQDGHHNGHHVQGDPAPSVVVAQNVTNIGYNL
jgi:hypothetical protein